MNPRKLEALERLYAQIPDAGCKGLCAEACGPILCTPLEAKRIEKRVGVDVLAWLDEAAADKEAWAPKPCVALKNGRCSAYAVRPAICRLYGSVEHPRLRCPHGCEPKALLSDGTARALLDECVLIGEPG